MAKLKGTMAAEMPDVEITEAAAPDISQKEKEAPSTRQRRPRRADVQQQTPDEPIMFNEENTITVAGKKIEIKPTKLLYMRNGSAMFYRIVDTYPITDIPMLPAGTVDTIRSGDKCLTDWLVAVTDNPDLVSNHINDFDGEVIHQMLQIFKRLNHITEKEEALKKAQTTGKEV